MLYMYSEFVQNFLIDCIVLIYRADWQEILPPFSVVETVANDFILPECFWSGKDVAKIFFLIYAAVKKNLGLGSQTGYLPSWKFSILICETLKTALEICTIRPL